MSKRSVWTSEHVALLGTMTDLSLAKMLGISDMAVNKRRNRVGIPAFGGRRVLWSDEHTSLLGKMPDVDLARRVGVTPAAVFYARRRAGIPAFSEWTGERIAMLGTMPDTAVAKLIGVHASVVHWKRTTLGIPRAPRMPPKVSGRTKDLRAAKRKLDKALTLLLEVREHLKDANGVHPDPSVDPGTFDAIFAIRRFRGLDGEPDPDARTDLSGLLDLLIAQSVEQDKAGRA